MAEAVLSPRLTEIETAAERLLEVESLDARDIAELFGPPLSAPPLVPVKRSAVPIAAAAPARPARELRPSARGWRPSLAALPFSLPIRWRRPRRKSQRPALAEA